MCNVHSSDFTIYYQNTRGLRTKTLDIYNYSTQINYSIIAFTETGLNDSFSDNELFSNNYSVYRSDRNYIGTNCRRGGGVLLAVNNKFNAVITF